MTIFLSGNLISPSIPLRLPMSNNPSKAIERGVLLSIALRFTGSQGL